MSRLNPLETLEPNESVLISEMTDILLRKMARDYPPGQMRREAHPKTLGVLKGRFSVEPDLPAELRVGLFAVGKGAVRLRDFRYRALAETVSG